jgi:hypothetical protein
MWSTLLTGKKYKIEWLPLLCLLLATGCGHTLKTRDDIAKNPTQPGPIQIEPISNPPSTPITNEPVESLPVREPGIEIFLGKGMATGFAYQGILKSLHDWKIKITKIHSQEVGALVAIAYAEKANVNRMDWTLSKFPENSFTNQTSGLLFKGLEKVETRLEKRLSESFQALKSEELTVPVVIEGTPSENLELWEKVRVTLTHPPLISAFRDIPKTETSPDLESLSREAANKIISVVVQSSSETKILQSIPGQLLVIQIGIPNFSDDDFKRRSQAAYYGRNQIEKLKKEILTFLQPGDLR